MIVNPKLKQLFNEIEKESIKYSNTPDHEKKYLRKLLIVFKESLTEDEQLYVFKNIVEFFHYKNIITDPDNILQLHNIKMRTYTYVMFLCVIVVLVVASVIKDSDSINYITTLFSNIFRIISF